VEILAKQYPLTLPAWFALIIRTFSALEGLGLSLDDKYRSDYP
jgi:predicted unusual protein kinase regulating ubiquinone biosynthesis (AarF/ABC1/UbiB family)